jgi:small subunit ribosomal protein S5
MPKKNDKTDEEAKVIEEIEKAAEVGKVEVSNFNKEAWQPKTELGKKVKAGEIKDIDYILDNGIRILEAEIVDALVGGLESDLMMIGQSKGKFGGGARRVFRQTQKKTNEGNKPSFATVSIIGNKDGYIGIGYGKSKETVPAREKALRNAKLNIMKVKRGCGSWACGCKQPHTIPYKVRGKCGAAEIELLPAPRGTGLCIEEECGKMLKMAGVTDIWSKKFGKTKSKLSLIYACLDALKKLTEVKTKPEDIPNLGIVEGSAKKREG